jgi:hypothetical protein
MKAGDRQAVSSGFQLGSAHISAGNREINREFSGISKTRMNIESLHRSRLKPARPGSNREFFPLESSAQLRGEMLFRLGLIPGAATFSL